jgi:hypothetical protein
MTQPSPQTPQVWKLQNRPPHHEDYFGKAATAVLVLRHLLFNDKLGQSIFIIFFFFENSAHLTPTPYMNVPKKVKNSLGISCATNPLQD